MYNGKDFPCTECGACCFRSCPALDNNKCSIYASRPLMCRVDVGYEIFRDSLSLREYHEATAVHCNVLQVKFGIPKEFRVILDNDEEHPDDYNHMSEL